MKMYSLYWNVSVNLDLEGFEDRGAEGDFTGIKLPYHCNH
jgi:hypothetical protein